MEKEMVLALKKNIEQIINWLQANADTEESIYIEYNFRKRSAFGSYTAHDQIYVPVKGTPKTGNLWGYHTTYKRLDKIKDYEMLEIVTQWSEIKERFLRNKKEMIEKRNKVDDAVFNFKV